MTLPYMNPENRYSAKYADFAAFFREQALAVDENPDVILNYCDHPAIQFLLTDRDSNTYERTCYLEAFSYGDPGVLLASPGPSLSGLIIKELGTQEQIDAFYQNLMSCHARTFFALTEPLKGSDAGALQAELTPDPHYQGRYYLNGEKCLFGNGAVGTLGITFARTHPGTLGVRAILLTPNMLNPASKYITRQNLPMTGLRGAQIAYMRFQHCPLAEEHLLGQHLRPMERGMMAIIKTFNRLRTGVGALAIGQAQAVLDYTYETKKTWTMTDKTTYRTLYYQIESARQLLLESAKIVDEDPFTSFDVSVSKIQSTQVAETVIKTCITFLSPAALIENQWLAKCYRDCFAWEYMEGTRNIQLKNVYQTCKTYLS